MIHCPNCGNGVEATWTSEMATAVVCEECGAELQAGDASDGQNNVWVVYVLPGGDRREVLIDKFWNDIDENSDGYKEAIHRLLRTLTYRQLKELTHYIPTTKD